jgi:hypothetical protein
MFEKIEKHFDPEITTFFRKNDTCGPIVKGSPGSHTMQKRSIAMFYVSAGVAIIGAVGYQYFVKRVSASLNPIVSIIGTYVVVLGSQSGITPRGRNITAQQPGPESGNSVFYSLTGCAGQD